MENQLVRTDNFLFKVKRFFRLLFIKNNSQNLNVNSIEAVQETSIELNKIISCKTEAQESNIKEQLANKLMKNELAIKELSNEEIEQMVQFFQEDIKLKSQQLLDIKKEIIKLKK